MLYSLMTIKSKLLLKNSHHIKVMYVLLYSFHDVVYIFAVTGKIYITLIIEYTSTKINNYSSYIYTMYLQRLSKQHTIR